MRHDNDPLIEALAQPVGTTPCALRAALAGESAARREAILTAAVHGPRGGRRLSRLLAEHSIAVPPGVLDRHRHSGCRACGIEVTR